MGENLYLLPSDMNLRIGTYVGYNNNILIAKSDSSLGSNRAMNSVSQPDDQLLDNQPDDQFQSLDNQPDDKFSSTDDQWLDQSTDNLRAEGADVQPMQRFL